MSLFKAQALLADIVRPINERRGLSHETIPFYTVETFVERVYLPIWGSRWKVSTAHMETDRIRYYIVRPLGARPLQFVTRTELQDLLNATAASLSRSVVDHMRFRLRSIFDLAVAECVIDRNPATALYTPRSCRAANTKRVLTSEQFGLMLELLQVREQAIIRLATIEGMRPGEILALRVSDIDFASGRISVKRRVYRGNIDTPKTIRSVREIGMSNGTAALI